jgi:hypothetical protein
VSFRGGDGARNGDASDGGCHSSDVSKVSRSARFVIVTAKKQTRILLVDAALSLQELHLLPRPRAQSALGAIRIWRDALLLTVNVISTAPKGNSDCSAGSGHKHSHLNPSFNLEGSFDAKTAAWVSSI